MDLPNPNSLNSPHKPCGTAYSTKRGGGITARFSPCRTTASKYGFKYNTSTLFRTTFTSPFFDIQCKDVWIKSSPLLEKRPFLIGCYHSYNRCSLPSLAPNYTGRNDHNWASFKNLVNSSNNSLIKCTENIPFGLNGIEVVYENNPIALYGSKHVYAAALSKKNQLLVMAALVKTKKQPK